MNNDTARSAKAASFEILSDVEIDVHILDEKWHDSFHTLNQIIDASVGASLSHFSRAFNGPIDVSIQCGNDDHIQALNKDYRDKDKPTNVLSFPGLVWGIPGKELETQVFEGQEALLGDIVLSIETILSEAKLQKKPSDNHLTHLIIHSVLHLLGFDHVDDEEAEEMEQIEIRLMKKLDLPNPYENNEVGGMSTADEPPRKAS